MQRQQDSLPPRPEPPSSWPLAIKDCSCPLHCRLLLESLSPSVSERRRRGSRPQSISSSASSSAPANVLASSSLRHRLCRRSQAEEIVMSPPQSAMHGMPRRFLSGVRLECRPVPVLFSSSVHLKIGSTKRRYTEKVFYQTRLVPWGYFEGATADFCHLANPGARHFIATMTLECSDVPHVRLVQPDEDDIDAETYA